MICYNCGKALTNSEYCSSCGANVSVYVRIVMLSNSYYNAGLTRAQNRDLSGAAEILNRAIKLNKNNTDARNLLGLVYNEMGETVQAFKEWVISTNLRPDNNPASAYISEYQRDRGKVSELNNAIKKFNIALEYAKNGTFDMAIIQLKKVINSNPNLVKAYQLLALVYVREGQYERARREIKRSLKIDRCNNLSIKYLREINEYLENEKKSDPDTRMARIRSLRGTITDRPYLSGNDVIIPRDTGRNANSAGQGILYMIIGLLLGAALVYFVVTPMRVSAIRSESSSNEAQYNQELAVKNSTIDELQEEVESLTSSNDELQEQLAQYTDTDNTVASNYSALLSAVNYYLEEDYETSAKKLEKVDSSLDMDSKSFNSVYKKLTSQLSSQVAETAYDAGLEAMNIEDWDEAITQFTSCLEADEDNVDAIYYLAWCYEHNGDTTNSQKYFQMIVDDYSDSDYYSVAQNKVSSDE